MITDKEPVNNNSQKKQRPPLNPNDYISLLPQEIIKHIALELDGKSLTSLANTSSLFKKSLINETIFKKLVETELRSTPLPEGTSYIDFYRKQKNLIRELERLNPNKNSDTEINRPKRSTSEKRPTTKIDEHTEKVLDKILLAGLDIVLEEFLNQYATQAPSATLKTLELSTFASIILDALKGGNIRCIKLLLQHTQITGKESPHFANNPSAKLTPAELIYDELSQKGVHLDQELIDLMRPFGDINVTTAKKILLAAFKENLPDPDYLKWLIANLPCDYKEEVFIRHHIPRTNFATFFLAIIASSNISKEIFTNIEKTIEKHTERQDKNISIILNSIKTEKSLYIIDELRPDLKNNYLLVEALQAKHFAATKYLLEKLKRDLENERKNKQKTILRLAIEANFPLNKDMLDEPSQLEKIDNQIRLLKSNPNFQPTDNEFHSLEILRTGLESYQNQEAWDPILEAVFSAVKNNEIDTSGNQAVLALLKALPPNKINIPLEKDGATALIIAIKNGNIELASQLLKVGAQIDIPDNDGQLPLHHAIKTLQIPDFHSVPKTTIKKIVFIKNHLINEETINVQNKDGDTALHLLFKRRDANDIKLLLPIFEGAISPDPSLTDKRGQTCFDLANKGLKNIKLRVIPDLLHRLEDMQRRWKETETKRELAETKQSKTNKKFTQYPTSTPRFHV